MSQIIRTKLVKMSDGYGMIMSKELIERLGLTGDIEVTVEDGYLDVRPVQRVRERGAEAR